MERDEENGQALYRGYIVAVLDVLGQKEAIRRLAKIDVSLENRTQIIDELQQSIGTRDSIQGLFQLFFKKKPHDLSQPHIQTLSDPQKATLYRYAEQQLKTYNFADTMIAYTPVLTSQGEPSLSDIYGILSGCAGTMLSSIADRTPIRGAVEIGYGLEPQETVEVYGPAFLGAYELGEHVAQYPRIVVGRELITKLEKWTQHPVVSLSDKLRYGLASQCGKLIGRDEDGCFFVDYLGDGYREIAGLQSAPLVEQGLTFAKGEHSRFVEANCPKLAARYAALLRYYEHHVPRWGLTP